MNRQFNKQEETLCVIVFLFSGLQCALDGDNRDPLGCYFLRETMIEQYHSKMWIFKIIH